MVKISVVINTLDEAELLRRVIKSVSWADEVVVCDMHSKDGSADLAKKLGAKVFLHEKVNYVEPARNFAIGKATGDWVLILDPDEEIPETLAKRLQEITDKMEKIDFVEIPRKNYIFNKWMKASMWWPDFNIRFFRKDAVKWSNKIHSKPETKGLGIKLEEDEKFAIIHRNYESVTQFIERMNRYSGIQAKELAENGIKFDWKDLISKPLGEFLSRFFANYGYKDGLHGLTLSLLQAFSFVVMYVKLWEIEKFKEQEIKLEDLNVLTKPSGQEINYWIKEASLSKNPFKRFLQKTANKIK